MATKRVGIPMGGGDARGLISVVVSVGRGGDRVDCGADSSAVIWRSS